MFEMSVLHDSVRERLLEKAEKLFAEKGYKGTNIREITREAECNIAAVNYYFGSKEKLYEAVFMRRIALLRDQRIHKMETAMAQAGHKATLTFVLETFAQAFFEPFLEVSEGRMIITLIAREMISPRLNPDLFYHEMVQPMVQCMGEALVKVGIQLPSKVLERCIFSYIAQLMHLVFHVQRFPQFGDLKTMLHHIIRFTEGGIQACQEG